MVGTRAAGTGDMMAKRARENIPGTNIIDRQFTMLVCVCDSTWCPLVQIFGTLPTICYREVLYPRERERDLYPIRHDSFVRTRQGEKEKESERQRERANTQK